MRDTIQHGNTDDREDLGPCVPTPISAPLPLVCAPTHSRSSATMPYHSISWKSPALDERYNWSKIKSGLCTTTVLHLSRRKPWLIIPPFWPPPHLLSPGQPLVGPPLAFDDWGLAPPAASTVMRVHRSPQLRASDTGKGLGLGMRPQAPKGQ